MTQLPTPPDPAQTPQPAQAVSPTGQALVSAKLAPFFASAAAVCAVVAGAAKIPGLHLPDEVFAYATLLALIFGTLLGTTPGLRKVVPMLLLVLSVGLVAPSCAHAQPASAITVTGDVLDGAGITFEAVLAGMKSASDAHALSATQVEAWNDFLARWRAGYHLTAKAWRDAKAKADGTGAEQAEAALGSLLGELAAWQFVIAKAAAQ